MVLDVCANFLRIVFIPNCPLYLQLNCAHRYFELQRIIPANRLSAPFVIICFCLAIPSCTFILEPNLMAAFTWYIFAFGFCVPSLLIIYFYARVLTYIHSHAKSFQTRQSQIPVKRVTFLTLSIVVFFFVCWTPYWSNVMYSYFYKSSDIGGEPYLLLVLHTLVYVNSSFNWIFYAFLNKHLRESRESLSEQNQLLKMPLRKSIISYHSTSVTQLPCRKRFATAPGSPNSSISFSQISSKKRSLTNL